MQEYLAKCSMPELVALLKKAKMDKRLMDFFPAEKRTQEHFNQHFTVSRTVTANSSFCLHVGRL